MEQNRENIFSTHYYTSTWKKKSFQEIMFEETFFCCTLAVEHKKLTNFPVGPADDLTQIAL